MLYLPGDETKGRLISLAIIHFPMKEMPEGVGRFLHLQKKKIDVGVARNN